MSDSKVYDVKPEVAKGAFINDDQYQQMYTRSIEDPEGFWSDLADEFVDWSKKWDKVWEYDFEKADIKWFEGAKLNVSYNCLDRHLDTRGDQVAIIWEGNEPTETRHL